MTDARRSTPARGAGAPSTPSLSRPPAASAASASPPPPAVSPTRMVLRGRPSWWLARGPVHSGTSAPAPGASAPPRPTPSLHSLRRFGTTPEPNAYRRYGSSSFLLSRFCYPRQRSRSFPHRISGGGGVAGAGIRADPGFENVQVLDSVTVHCWADWTHHWRGNPEFLYTLQVKARA